MHFQRNVLAHVPKGQHDMVAAAIRQALIQPGRKSADQPRARWPKLADLMDESEADVLAYMSFPAQHRTKLHSTNPLERLNKEVKRRAVFVGSWDRSPDRRGAVRTKRRMAEPAPLHAGRGLRPDRRR